MPNDMSRPHRQLTLPAFTGTVSLAQSIDRLREHPGLSLTRRRDLMSGLRSIARTLNTDPASLPADISILRARLAKSAEPSPGISDKTRQNCLSNATGCHQQDRLSFLLSGRHSVPISLTGAGAPNSPGSRGSALSGRSSRRMWMMRSSSASS